MLKSLLNGMAFRVWCGLFAVIWLALGIWVWQFGQGWVRNYGGDILVVGFMLWCMLVLWPRMKIITSASWVLVIAIAIELSQFLELRHLRQLLGEQYSSLILGHTFDWLDLLSYALGLVLCFPLAQWAKNRSVRAKQNSKALQG